MYQIKQIPEDFIVKERSTIIPTPHGRYLYVLLRKTNRNTLDVVKELSRILRIKDKQIGFAGSKAGRWMATLGVCPVTGLRPANTWWDHSTVTLLARFGG